MLAWRKNENGSTNRVSMPLTPATRLKLGPAPLQRSGLKICLGQHPVHLVVGQHLLDVSLVCVHAASCVCTDDELTAETYDAEALSTGEVGVNHDTQLSSFFSIPDQSGQSDFIAASVGTTPLWRCCRLPLCVRAAPMDA